MTLTKPKKELWGGVIEFSDLEPGTYTATAEAWNTDENILEGSGSTEIAVRAGETTDCNITMILEGQIAYYSQYMILTDYENNKHIYDYKTSQISSKSVSFGTSYNAVEDNNGQIYHIKDTALYKDDELVLSVDTSNLIKNPLYYDYDSKTDSLWLASFESSLAGNFVNFSVFENPSAATSNPNPYKISYDDINSSITSCQAFAVKGDNIYIAYNNSNILLTKKNDSSNTKASISLSSITPALSGEVTDMAVLEDGTVAVLVRSVGVGTETEGFDSMLLNDKDTVYSRGALVLLSSDLSTYKVYGWTDSPRTISAKLNSDSDDPYNGASGNSQIASITAYIPDYAERNSHFYGPMRIVAIRPKELVIADCGANFVLPDYIGKKNGKMFTHNRLMTVNLRNFAIGCKKEFSESELKFQYLTISGNLEYVTAGWTDLSAENEK